jgi:hypothetical protein
MTNATFDAKHRRTIVAAMADYSRSLYAQAEDEGMHTDIGDMLLTLSIQYNKDANAVLDAPTVGANGDFVVVDQFVLDMAQTALQAAQEDAEQRETEARRDRQRAEAALSQVFPDA